MRERLRTCTIDYEERPSALPILLLILLRLRAILRLKFLLQYPGQVQPHVVLSLGQGPAWRYLDTPLWAAIFTVLHAGPNPGTQANKVLDEVLHEHIVARARRAALYGNTHNPME